MLADYRVNVYSPITGLLVAAIDDWRRIELHHKVNLAGYASITISGQNGLSPVFIENAPIEIWRRIPGYSPSAVPASMLREDDWYVEWSGLHGDELHTTYENGDEAFTSYADGALDLVGRREVLWHSSKVASESKKVAIPAQTAIYQFVYQNCGPGALAASGRFINGAIATLDVPALTGSGANWSGMRSFRNVLEVIKEIGDYGNIDYDIVSIGDGQWRFETYPGGLGEDRTVDGLDPSTGLNGSGNAPVIFSLDNHNVAEATYKTTRRKSATVAVALGQGQYATRAYGIYINTSEIDANRIAQREITRNANTQSDAGELTVVAEEWGSKLQPTKDFVFTPSQNSRSTIYGVHYWLADQITARYLELELNKRLLGLTIVIDQNGEAFRQWEFETISQ